MKLLICIPAYNEEAIIVPTIEAVSKALLAIPNLSWHIVVADNASTDGTSKKVTERSLPSVSTLQIPQKGKGTAIKTAASYTHADVFGFIDADLSADPADIALLLREIEAGADLAIGSRLLNTSSVHRSFLRTLSSILFNTARKVFLGVRVSDSQCGLKFMNERGLKLLQSCQEQTWFLDAELLARATRAGLRIKEVPIAWEEERYVNRKSKLSVVRDGFGAIRAFWRIRRNMRIS
jgi:glycosyltransferase involved in cell wall biosynthesis